MDPAAGHGSRSKHQACWAAAEQEVFKRRGILAWKKSFDLGGWLVFYPVCVGSLLMVLPLGDVPEGQPREGDALEESQKEKARERQGGKRR